MTHERRILGLAVSVGLVFLAAWTGYLSGEDGMGGWYRSLEKPAWTPPGWLFGPVWTALYLMMAVAAWRVWTKAGWPKARIALLLYLVQLVLNALWTPAFFGLRSPVTGLVVIVLLWLFLAATVRAFFRLDRWAGVLLVPYLGWVTFALVLNAAIWRLNG